MKKLSNDWLTEGLIDFEYKKYQLLAYLQGVEAHFQAARLYPALSELVFHYKNLLSVKQNKQLLYENFPAHISREEFQQLKLAYVKVTQDDHFMREIEDILSFSIPEFERYLEEGKSIYQYIEENLSISPVGVVPIRTDEGYVFLQQTHRKETDVYGYHITIFESASENYRGIHLRYLETVQRGLANTWESLKIGLVRRYVQLPNPATYLIESAVACPVEETLLPVTKRFLIKYITTATGGPAKARA